MKLAAARRRLRRAAARFGWGIQVAAWNAHNAPGPVLRDYIRDSLDEGAVAIVLTEVWTRHRDLARIARDLGLTMHAETPGNRRLKVVPEQGDTVVLTVATFEIETSEVIKLEQQWRVFTAERDHQPRRLIRVVGKIYGLRVELLGVHGPTRGNRAAVAEFKAAVVRILERTSPGTLSIAAGDFNVRLEDARAWAAAHGFRVSGRGPDLALVNGGRTRSKRRRKRRSDHYAMKHAIRPSWATWRRNL